MGARWLVMALFVVGCASAERRPPDASKGGVEAGEPAGAEGTAEEALCGVDLFEDAALGPVREAPVGDRSLGASCGEGFGACASDGVCVYPEGSPCGAGGVAGVCEARPRGCPRDCPKVCACGGATFCNACVARARGFSVKARGRCPEDGHEPGGRP